MSKYKGITVLPILLKIIEVGFPETTIAITEGIYGKHISTASIIEENLHRIHGQEF